mgnify:CR=1 FL=1
MRGRSFESTVLFSSDFFNENEGETSSLPSFCFPTCKIEDGCHVMDQSVIIIRRTFFEVIECVFYIQPIGISEKNYKVMT